MEKNSFQKLIDVLVESKVLETNYYDQTSEHIHLTAIRLIKDHNEALDFARKDIKRLDELNNKQHQQISEQYKEIERLKKQTFMEVEYHDKIQTFLIDKGFVKTWDSVLKKAFETLQFYNGVLKDHENSIKAKEVDVAAKEANIERLHETLKEKQKEVENLYKQILQVEEERGNYYFSITVYKEQIEKLTATNEQQAEIIKEQISGLYKLSIQAENDYLRKELQSLREILAQRDNRLMDRQELKNRVASLETVNEHLREALDAKGLNISGYEDEIKRLKGVNASQQQTIKVLYENTLSIPGVDNDMDYELFKLRDRNQKLQAKLQEAKNDAKVVENFNTELKKKLKNYLSDNDRLRDKIEQLESILGIEGLKAIISEGIKILQIQSVYARGRFEREKISAEIESLETALRVIDKFNKKPNE